MAAQRYPIIIVKRIEQASKLTEYRGSISIPANEFHHDDGVVIDLF